MKHQRGVPLHVAAGMALLSVVVLVGVMAAYTALSQPGAVLVVADDVSEFGGAAVGERVGGLIWLGGVSLESPHREFGEFSGISLLDAERFVMVSDKGYFLSGRLTTKDGELTGIANPVLRAIWGAGSLISSDMYDAEAVAVVRQDGAPVSLRVGFERHTRVVDYELVDGAPVGSAAPVKIPRWLSEIKSNRSIESICIDTINGNSDQITLIIVEDNGKHVGHSSGTIIMGSSFRDVSIVADRDYKPTACTFLPGGDLLVLYRAESEADFSTQIKRISNEAVRSGAVLDGPVLLEAHNTINLEGMDVWRTPEGKLRLVLVSDNGDSRDSDGVILQFSF